MRVVTLLCAQNTSTKCSGWVLQRQSKVRPGVAGPVGQCCVHVCVCVGAGAGGRQMPQDPDGSGCLSLTARVEEASHRSILAELDPCNRGAIGCSALGLNDINPDV